MIENQPPGDNDSAEENQLWNLLQGSQPKGRPREEVVDGAPEGVVADARTAETRRFYDQDIPDGFEPEQWQEAREGEDKEVSRLQQLLNDPDTLGPGEDLSRSRGGAEEAGADYDRAVHEFYQNDQVEVRCRKYPDEIATTQCPECQAFYSQRAMTVRRGRLLCVDCAEALFVKSEAEILDEVERGEPDPASEIALPEIPEFEIGNRAFGLEGRPAHPLRKLLALLIDWGITRFLILGVLFIWGSASDSGSPLFSLFSSDSGGTQLSRLVDAFVFLKPIPYWLILFAVTDYLYYFLSLAFWNRSIGMSWAGIRVVTEWGEFASFSPLLIRTLIFIVLFEAPAILISQFFPAYRGLHDYAAGTVVVNYSGVKRVDAYETIQIKLN